MNRRVKIAIVLLLVVVLAFVLLWSNAGQYRRAAEAYKRDLRARGEKLTMVELAPAPTNDPERAKVFLDLMAAGIPTNFPSAMKMVIPGAARSGAKNAAPGEMIGFAENADRVAKLGEILGTNRLGFNLDYSAGIDTRLSQLSFVKAAELLAVGTESQALATNDLPQARSELSTAVDLVRLYDDNPLVIVDLVHVAMANIAVGGTWEALQSGQWTEPQLGELQAKWEGIDLFDRIEPALRMERAYGVEALNKYRKADDATLQNYEDISTPSFGSSADDSLAGVAHEKLREVFDRAIRFPNWRRSGSYDEELLMLQYRDADFDLAHQIRTTGEVSPALKAYERQSASVKLLHPAADHFLLGDTDDSLKNYVLKAATAEVARRLTVIAIALERHRLQQGRYPASLDELVPAYLSQVPTDLMDGKPLRYKLQPDDNFLLYSVGQDGEDNGGDPVVASPNSTNNWTKGRDIVWPRAATPKEIEEYQKRQPGTKAAAGK